MKRKEIVFGQLYAHEDFEGNLYLGCEHTHSGKKYLVVLQSKRFPSDVGKVVNPPSGENWMKSFWKGFSPVCGNLVVGFPSKI